MWGKGGILKHYKLHGTKLPSADAESYLFRLRTKTNIRKRKKPPESRPAVIEIDILSVNGHILFCHTTLDRVLKFATSLPGNQ